MVQSKRWLLVSLVFIGCGSSAAPTSQAGGSSSSALASTEDASTNADAAETTLIVSTDDSAGPAGSTSSGSDTTVGGDSTGASALCGGPTFSEGRQDDIDIGFGGSVRSYDLYVPPGLDPTQPVPLVINLHAYLSSDDIQANFSNFDEAADEAGVVVAYPKAAFNSWNAGACCGQAQLAGNDDVGFVRAVVADVQGRGCVDPSRIYATGMSNGGFMTHRLACEAADLFAAVAPVAGVIGLDDDDCTPSRPIPVMHFHGTADFVVSYYGGLFASVNDTIEGWVARNGCSATPTRIVDVGEAYCDAYEGCADDATVTLCTVEGGGHCWPGNPACLGAFSTTLLDANTQMLEFFSGVALP
ncbi:MAG: PHB depolymerase family esterase [Myxococcota bacterium]